VLKWSQFRAWRLSVLLVPLLAAPLAAAGEPFQQGGPIGSQTSDGYNALGPSSRSPSNFPITFTSRRWASTVCTATRTRGAAPFRDPAPQQVHGLPPEHRVGQGQAADQEAVRVLEKQQAIPWKKVHDLPDFVRFNHERHIQRFIFDQERPPRSLRLLPRRRGEHDHGAPGQGDFDGMVHKLSREGP